eukprot:13238702-Alexandrium_andersonii.AAC.1
MDTASAYDDPMLEALLGRMSARVADEARSIRVLFTLRGCEPRAAALKVVELYSPPRVTRELQSRGKSRRFPNLALSLIHI